MRAGQSRVGSLTLKDIAARFGGRVCGDPGVLISQVGSLENATSEQITFFSNHRFKSRLEQSRAGAVILDAVAQELTSLPRIVAENPYAYFARVSSMFNPDPPLVPGVHRTAIVEDGAQIASSARIGPGAVIGSSAVIGEGCSIGAGCHVGEGVEIGEGSTLYPSVVVYADCRIGARARLHSGVVIGADGFGIAADGGRWEKIPQIGRVLIGDDVEIGANTTIDRGAIDDTVLEDGVKLDNQIQIGHNCHVGAHTAMAGCVAVAGSARIGRHCTIGAGSVILGHLSIADHVHISASTVISRSLHKPGTYTGMYPFDENASWARNTAQVRHLFELAQRVKTLEKRLAEKENKDG